MWKEFVWEDSGWLLHWNDLGKAIGLRSPPRKNKLKRNTYVKHDPKESIWWLEYHLDYDNLYHLGNLLPFKMRQFKHRFRMSRAALSEFIALCRRHEWFKRYDLPSNNYTKRRAPLELLIRSLARLGGVVSLKFYVIWQTFPHKHIVPSLKNLSPLVLRNCFIVRVYAPVDARWNARSNGCLHCGRCSWCVSGSRDAVRIRCWSMHYNLRHFNIEKEGYPVKTFQVACGYSYRIYSCTRAWDGKEPDVKITLMTRFCCELKTTYFYGTGMGIPH